ncbi:hypothetical protein L6452_43504 [Arctium lappa]|uniref:Uncharacterized protein n=1 Tax=Arctium lappa TaxID=4217 RepID=A0ACB8XDM6_ARCLA|nr:hypothetical protein L6452_43504 [Arctium lappa]
MLLQSDLAGKRSQFATENKTASERTFVCFFSTKHGSLRIIVGRWLPKETPIRSATRLGGIYLIPITRRDIAYAVHVVSQLVSASIGPRRGIMRHSLGNSPEDHTGHRECISLLSSGMMVSHIYRGNSIADRLASHAYSHRSDCIVEAASSLLQTSILQ